MYVMVWTGIQSSILLNGASAIWDARRHDPIQIVASVWQELLLRPWLRNADTEFAQRVRDQLLRDLAQRTMNELISFNGGNDKPET
jgi:hypothetical protein